MSTNLKTRQMGGTLIIALAYGAFLVQGQEYLVLQKGLGSLATYTIEGERRSTVPTGSHPQEMVRSRVGRHIYVTDGDNSVSVMDPFEHRKFAEISLGEFHSPHGIDLRDAGQLVVTTSQPEQLLVIDPVKRSVLRHFDTKGKGAGWVTLGSTGKWAYVSNTVSSNVSAVDLASGRVKLIPTGGRPEGSVLSSNGGELYVCNREAASVTVIDTVRQSAIANIPVGKGPTRIVITPDGNTLVYALMYDKKIGFANPKTRRQTDYMILPWRPTSVQLSPDGAHVLVSCEEADTIYVISMAQKRIVREIPAEKGAGPGPIFPVR